MELRSCNHLHFIQALEGGLVVKTLNVACGRPVLRFKELKDIHERLDAKNGDSFPRIPPKDEFRGSVVNGDRVMGESPSRRTVGNVTVKTEPEVYDFDSSDGNAGRNNDLDGFGNITLKQIKETCKDKKRKRSTSVDLKKIETCSPVKHEFSKLQTDEEDVDLIEPLSKWKLSKKAKANTKSKHKKKGFSSTSQISISTITSEHIPSEPESGLNIKVEVPETEFSDIQNTIPAAGDTSLACDNQDGSCGVVPDESPAIAADCVFETKLPIYETNESQICVVNEVCYEDMECADPTPIQIVTTSEWDIVEVDDSEFNSDECLDLPLLEYNIEGHITNSVHPDNFIEAICSAQDQNFDLHNTISSEDERLCQTNSETQVRISEVVGDDLFQCMGPVNGTDSCLSEPDMNDDSPWNVESSAGSGSGLVSVADDSPVAEEEKQSPKSACAGAERNLSPGIFSSDATDELTTLVSGGSPSLNQQHPPQRLFPTRKVISPTSQEKLCKAMKSIELHGEEHPGCKANLCFGKQTERTIGGGQGPDQIKRAKLSIKVQNNGNPKNEKINSHPKGIPKASKVSAAPPRFTTGCTSIRTCSESAIAFSQRQMQDIESLATKLTIELQTMKEIAEERLLPEAYHATPLKYNANEVQMAIRNATRVEASAKRLLSMMSRDCNRFCKIMKMADIDVDASENVANKDKEGKKIVFADEAGEKLCHVKFFENDLATFSDQNLDFLVK
ncbi:unnamed protein product [Malus baccata var. baccata]